MSGTGKDKRPGFYIYRTAAVLFENLPPEVTGLVIRAASRYFRTGEKPDDLSPEAQAIFEMFAQSMDEDAERYNQKCEKKRQAQAKRWEQQKQRDAETSDTKDTSVYNCIQPYTNVYQTNSNPIATQPNSNTISNQYQPNSNPSTAGAVGNNSISNTAAVTVTNAGPPQAKSGPERGAREFSPPSEPDVIAYFTDNGGTAQDAAAFVDHYTANGWMMGSSRMRDWKAAARGWIRRKANEQPKAPNKKRTPADWDRLEQEIMEGNYK